MSASNASKPFRMDFSNRVIEHLGIKLYQNKPTNVIAEFVSNSWDADAKNVNIDLKFDYASRPTIAIVDDGRGMTRNELTDEFLVIGRNRRSDPKDKTVGGRFPMGRKGIGKLAGFGIAKTVDIISIPNAQLRKGSADAVGVAYWLRFELPQMIADSSTAALSGYDPIVVGDGIDIATLEKLLSEKGALDAFAKLVEQAKAGNGGVGVYLHDTSLKKAIRREGLLQSLGARFTVTMLRPDFTVKVNGHGIKQSDAFPTFLDFGFGSASEPITEFITVGDDQREVKFWVKFVALQDIDWPIENAGIGVYTHGKIAQDRPFFFGVRGKDIYSRYIYGVVEADWLDEMAEDVVSTDRRGIDWTADSVSVLHDWGAKKFSEWIAAFRKWRASISKADLVDRIRKVAPPGTLSGGEEDALASLLTEVLPIFGNDEEAKNRTALSFTEAWTHAPTRQLTQALWKKVFASSDIDPGAFATLVESLRSSQVPEAMGLAVTMAQRIGAITSMRRMLEEEKTETQLQRLVEQFPWLLGPEWEKLTANESIRTLVQKKHKPDTAINEWPLSKADGSLKPDFVFLSDVGMESEIVIFELKGPECGKTLQPVEYMQLRAYVDIIQGVYNNCKIQGILVGHEKDGIIESDRRIKVTRWSDVLSSARALHVSYLGALLKASEPGANDARLKQIADFGGKETIELLKRLAPLGGFDELLVGTLFSDAPLAN